MAASYSHLLNQASAVENKIPARGQPMSIMNGVQIFVSLVLIAVILIQVKGQGSGFFGAAESSYHTRRGMEKTLFQFTIFMVLVFIGISILSVRFQGLL